MRAVRVGRALFVTMIAAFAAFFMVIPQRGFDRTVVMLDAPGLARSIGAEEAWSFEPANLEVEPGARIAFRNDSTITHTATCSGCPWDTGDVQPGQTKFLTFDTDAEYQYFCRYHGQQLGMIGTLVVGNPPPPTTEPTPPPGDGALPPGGGTGLVPPTQP